MEQADIGGEGLEIRVVDRCLHALLAHARHDCGPIRSRRQQHGQDVAGGTANIIGVGPGAGKAGRVGQSQGVAVRQPTPAGVVVR